MVGLSLLCVECGNHLNRCRILLIQTLCEEPTMHVPSRCYLGDVAEAGECMSLADEENVGQSSPGSRADDSSMEAASLI